MHRNNGRRLHDWEEPEEPRSEDPEDIFPMDDVLTDCAGRKRKFKIEYWKAPTGHVVEAKEVGRKTGGYEFRAFDSSHPGLALGELRRKMNQELSRRYVEKKGASWCPRHDELRGRITMADGAPAFVIDGQLLTLEEFGQLLCVCEGWNFYFRFEGH
ncbi:MAG: hypothetical protein HY720_06890 [Planctomycetes bacterium]|nr:hypothetical protein [Planctomycetota bacterium]